MKLKKVMWKTDTVGDTVKAVFFTKFSFAISRLISLFFFGEGKCHIKENESVISIKKLMDTKELKIVLVGHPGAGKTS